MVVRLCLELATASAMLSSDAIWLSLSHTSSNLQHIQDKKVLTRSVIYESWMTWLINFHTLASSGCHLFLWAYLRPHPRLGGWWELISLPFSKYHYGSSTILPLQRIPAYHEKVQCKKTNCSLYFSRKCSVGKLSMKKVFL